MDLLAKTPYQLLMEIEELEKIRERYEEHWSYDHAAIKHFIITEIDNRVGRLEDLFDEVPDIERCYLEEYAKDGRRFLDTGKSIWKHTASRKEIEAYADEYRD
jgi:hypothetical protein